MAYKVIILYRLYMPPYFLGTFTEYPYGITIEILVRNILHTILFGSIHFLVGLLYGHVNGV